MRSRGCAISASRSLGYNGKGRCVRLLRPADAELRAPAFDIEVERRAEGKLRGRAHFFLPPPWPAPPAPCCAAKGELGAAAFGLSFFGFFASRLPRC